MKGIVFHAPGDFRTERVDDPRLEADTDAIVRVEAEEIGGGVVGEITRKLREKLVVA